PASTSGSLAIMAQNGAVRVTSDGVTTTAWTVNSSLSYANGSVIGTQTLGAGGDPTGATRAALNIARVCDTARSWATARTTDSIPNLLAVFNSSGSPSSGYILGNGS